MISPTAISPYNKRGKNWSSYWATPTDVTGLEVWYDSDSIVDSGSGTASQLTDLSGNARHASTETANRMPSIIASNLNGHNAIRFDGSNDRLFSPAFTLSQPFTFFIVAKLITTGESDASLFGSKTSPYTALVRYTGGNTLIYAGTNSQLIETGQSTDLSCFSAIINGASSFAFRNEVQSYLIGPGANSMAGGVNVGGYADVDSTCTNFDFYSLIIYSGALTNYERLRIIEYLGNRYDTDFKVGINVLGFQTEKFDGVFDNSVEYADKTTYKIRNAFTEYSFITTDEYVRLSAMGSIYSHIAAFSKIAVYEDNVYLGNIKYLDAINEFGIALSSGSKKVTLVEPGQASLSGHVYPEVAGTYLTSIKLKNYTKVNEGNVATKMVFVGDSILVGGDYATITQQQAVARLFKVEDNISSACLAFGSARLAVHFAADANVIATQIARINALFENTTTRKVLVMLIGTNDYAAGTTAVNFTTYYGNFLDAINAADSDIEVFCISPTIRNGETSLLDDYRTAISGLCTVRPTYTTYIEGKTILTLPGDFGADGLHPTIAGSKKLKDAVDAVIFP